MIAYFSLIIFPFCGQIQNIAKLLQRGKMLVFFPLVFILFMFFHKLSQFLENLFKYFAAAAVVTAAGLIIIRWDLIAGGGRLYGWGRAENPVQCGCYMGLLS